MYKIRCDFRQKIHRVKNKINIELNINKPSKYKHLILYGVMLSLVYKPNIIMKTKQKQELGNFLLMCFNANKSDDFNVFFDFSGHIEAVHFRICTNDMDEDALFTETLYVKGSLYDEVKFKNKMKIWRNELMKIINPVIELSEA